MRSTLYVVLSVFCIAQMFSFRSAASSLSSQPEHRLIKRTFPHEPEPIEIVEFKKGDKSFQFNEPVLGDSNWLSGLEVTVRNTSNKAITHFKINIAIPDPNGSQKVLAVLSFVDAGSPTHAADVAPTMSFKPGEIKRLRYSDKLFAKLQQVQSSLNVNTDNYIVVTEVVVFDDDTSWRAGYLHRRDPDNPNHWKAIRSDIPRKVSYHNVRPPIKMQNASFKSTSVGFHVKACLPVNSKERQPVDLRNTPYWPASVVRPVNTCGFLEGYYSEQCSATIDFPFYACYTTLDDFLFDPDYSDSADWGPIDCTYEGDCCYQCYHWHYMYLGGNCW